MKNLKLQFLTIVLVFVGFFTSCTTEDVSNSSNVSKDNGTTAKAAVITYKVKQYIFQRPAAAFGLGHVGVGYEVRTYSDGVQASITYYYGAVENGKGSPVVLPGGNNGGWYATAATGATMLNNMKNNYGYVNYKYKTAFTALSSTQRANAYNCLAGFPGRGYVLATNNCMNASWDVLWWLGTSNVAWVENNYFPNDWFNRCTVGWSGSTAL